MQFNDTLPVDPDDQDERTKVRAYLPDGSYSYSLTGPIAGDDAYEGRRLGAEGVLTGGVPMS